MQTVAINQICPISRLILNSLGNFLKVYIIFKTTCALIFEQVNDSNFKSIIHSVNPIYAKATKVKRLSYH